MVRVGLQVSRHTPTVDRLLALVQQEVAFKLAPWCEWGHKSSDARRARLRERSHQGCEWGYQSSDTH